MLRVDQTIQSRRSLFLAAQFQVSQELCLWFSIRQRVADQGRILICTAQDQSDCSTLTPSSPTSTYVPWPPPVMCPPVPSPSKSAARRQHHLHRLRESRKLGPIVFVRSCAYSLTNRRAPRHPCPECHR